MARSFTSHEVYLRVNIELVVCMKMLFFGLVDNNAPVKNIYVWNMT